MLFGNGLVLESSEDEDYHRAFHFDVSDLIHFAHKDRKKSGLENDIKSLGFHFSEDLGFYLPNFEFNVLNRDYKEQGMQKGKERTFAHIHYSLGKLN